MRIYIVGMPGTGKTYFGRMLAKSLNLGFRDLDEQIERSEGMPARQIIQSRGEKHFRDLEREGLKALSENSHIVISCGGGTPVFFDNMEFMKNRGIVIWLHTDLAIIGKRISQNITRRPMFAGMSEEEVRVKLLEIYEKRRKIYAKADITAEVNTMQASVLNTVIQKVVKISKRRFK